MKNIKIRKMTRTDLDIAMQWAALEGWNFGTGDPYCFFRVDPDNLLMGYVDDKPAGCISAFAYPPNFAFLGLFIVRESFRGQGYGKILWNAALKHAGKRVCGLDGVLPCIPLYKTLGFAPSYVASCAETKVVHVKNIAPEIKKLSKLRFQKICDFDKQYFPADRTQFLDVFVRMPGTIGLAYVSDDEIQGYGAIRPCRNGWKISPLFAKNAVVAEAIYDALQNCVDEGATIFINLPENNPGATALGAKIGAKTLFQTMRMYNGPEPKFDHSGVYGVTSFEVG